MKKSSSFEPHTAEIFNNRLKLVSLLVVFVFFALVFRLWYLQLIKGSEYRIKSENNRIRLQDIPPFRGMIFDRQGDLLVDNRPSYDMYIIPEDVQDKDKLLDNLGELADLDREQALQRLSAGRKYPFRPVLIKRDLSWPELARVETNLYNLPGVMIQVKPQRNYLFGKFASHVIGYLGEISETQLASGRYPDNKRGDLIGKYGVEMCWQKQLNGFRGGEQVEVDAAGRKLRVISRKPPVSGANIALTLDKDLQILAEECLNGKKGAVVALDPGTGEILAMASRPAFDPNLFIRGIDPKEWRRIVSSKDSPLQNRAIAGQYPPGSVFKIVVALAGLEEGILDPSEEVFCNGSYTVGRRSYRCWKRGGHGPMALHDALVQSCDVYFYKLGRRLGVDKIAEYAERLGLGHRPGFDLGMDKPGLIPTTRWKLKRWGIPWQPGETISTSIGQSYVLVTPLQMALMIAAIFNGGVLYQPQVIKWVGKDGRMIREFKPVLKRRLNAKPENLELIKYALVGVVNEPRGTGRRAKVKGITVAGKTGTAQVVTLEKEKIAKAGGEVPPEFRDHAWFVAVAPAEHPRLAIAVLVENGGHGGSAAAPIAGRLIEAYFTGKRVADAGTRPQQTGLTN
ncbi:MAG: penicillin-binding protein 2 [Deltaproteobacteria bacterium]|nr:penicillin-binding protein 2 [Deltaproteobacteria bacterium]MBW2017063.1 penicillin-binding protein 2 [Deltaproteobacteria bacterium]